MCGVNVIVASSSKIDNSSNRAFKSQAEQPKLAYDKDTVLKNNLGTRARISYDKLTNATTIYPAKGLSGNKNANFYEFLTMGTVPYLIGSGTLMAVSNLVNKHFDAFSKKGANINGGKMALGVLFYGLAKELSKPLVSMPVKAATGVDVNLPYAKVIYELPDYKDDTDITSIEYHKVFESVEFPRFDLLYGDEAHGEKRNVYYDKIAKKLGLGENLKDSDQELKPRIKEIVTKTNAVTSLTSYLWAGVGVGLAFQKPWENFFNVATLKFWNGRKFAKSLSSLGKSFVDSAKELYTGGENATRASKIGGKALIAAAVLATVVGDLNIIKSRKKPSKLDASDVIEKNRKFVVN
jgi:hypothetical protein